MGLGYSRGVFLRYSREIESLVGEYSMVNNSLKNGGDDDTAIGTFRFQRESLDEIISRLSLPFEIRTQVVYGAFDHRITIESDPDKITVKNAIPK